MAHDAPAAMMAQLTVRELNPTPSRPFTSDGKESYPGAYDIHPESDLKNWLAILPDELILKCFDHILATFKTWKPTVDNPDYKILRMTSRQISRLADTYRYHSIVIRPQEFTSLKESISLLKSSTIAASVRSVHIAYNESAVGADKAINISELAVLSEEEKDMLRSAHVNIESSAKSILDWVTPILFRLPRLREMRLPPSTMQTGSLTIYPPLELFRKHSERLPCLQTLSLKTNRAIASSVLDSLVRVSSLRTLEIEGWQYFEDETIESSMGTFEKVSEIEDLHLHSWSSVMLGSFFTPRSLINYPKALRSLTINAPLFPTKNITDLLVASLKSQKHSLEQFHIEFNGNNAKVADGITLINFREFHKLQTLYVPSALLFRYTGGTIPTLSDSLPPSLRHLTIHGTWGEPVPSRVRQLANTADFPNVKSVKVLDHSNFTPNVYEDFQVAGIAFIDHCMLENCHTAKSILERIKGHREHRELRGSLRHSFG